MPKTDDELMDMLSRLDSEIAAKLARERYIKSQWPMVVPQKIVGWAAIYIGLPAIPIGLLMGDGVVWRFGLGLFLFSVALSFMTLVLLWPGLRRATEQAKQQHIDINKR